tara:strand:- start:2133 stop:2504 length:372 start_codon:yes stop_codon:yes gene_type:complete
MKIKLTEFAQYHETDFNEALDIVKEKLPEEYITGKGKNTWLSVEAQDILADGMLINEIIPKHYKGKVLSICPNPRFNMVHFVEIGKKVPVLIPNRLKGKFLGKVICFEVIESETGVSYRYVKG